MNTNTVAAGLADVRAQFDSWRKQRRRGQRIPARLWRRAARAAREYGLSPVSHALGLDYHRLKRWAERTGTKPGPEPVFVEVSAQSAPEGTEPERGLACVVELHKGNGARMRICVRDALGVDWGKLKEAFLGA